MNLFSVMAPFFALILLFWFATRLVVSDADKNRMANETKEGIEFLPNRRSYWGLYIIVAMLTYPLIAVLARGIKSAEDLSVVLLCLGFNLFLLTTFPGSIVSNDEGLEQTYWFGGNKRVAWNNVARFEIDRKRKRVIVKARNGAKIVHTRQLPDKNRIIGEIEMHCPGKLPADAAQQLAS